MSLVVHAPSPYCGECGKVHSANDSFYVSAVKSSKQYTLLLGPYATHEEAVGNVERGRHMAEQVDPWVHFYAFGTASSKVAHGSVFGK